MWEAISAVKPAPENTWVHWFPNSDMCVHITFYVLQGYHFIHSVLLQPSRSCFIIQIDELTTYDCMSKNERNIESLDIW